MKMNSAMLGWNCGIYRSLGVSIYRDSMEVNKDRSAWLAQSKEHVTPDLLVMSSSLMLGVEIAKEGRKGGRKEVTYMCVFMHMYMKGRENFFTLFTSLAGPQN